MRPAGTCGINALPHFGLCSGFAVTFRPMFMVQGDGVLICGEVSDSRQTLLREVAMPTIALVDDDRNILTSVSIALEAEGYRIMTYTDGASAPDRFATSTPSPATPDIHSHQTTALETA